MLICIDKCIFLCVSVFSQLNHFIFKSHTHTHTHEQISKAISINDSVKYMYIFCYLEELICKIYTGRKTPVVQVLK